MRKEMFNPLRLFRRRDHIDDSSTAYIEGRMTAAEQVEMESRLINEPGLKDELDSLRATISLLRSIEPARAPRSFTLAEAPMRAPRRKPKYRLAMAPAVLAVVAAAGVGLLAVGNLADVVSQSGTSGNDDSSQLDMSAGAIISDMEGEASDSSIIVMPTQTPGPIGTLTPPNGFAPPPTPEDSEFHSDASRIPGPDTEFDSSVGQEIADLTPPDGSDISKSEIGDGSTSAIAGTGIEEIGIAPPVAGSVENVDEGLSLPIWQLQLALAALAVAMVAIWAFMRRRISV